MRVCKSLLLTETWGEDRAMVITCSAILFASTHIYVESLAIVFGSFLLRLFWAKKREDIKTISGVTVSHF